MSHASTNSLTSWTGCNLVRTLRSRWELGGIESSDNSIRVDYCIIISMYSSRHATNVSNRPGGHDRASILGFRSNPGPSLYPAMTTLLPSRKPREEVLPAISKRFCSSLRSSRLKLLQNLRKKEQPFILPQCEQTMHCVADQSSYSMKPSLSI